MTRTMKSLERKWIVAYKVHEQGKLCHRQRISGVVVVVVVVVVYCIVVEILCILLHI